MKASPPLTGTGAALFVAVPFPKRPDQLNPQQYGVWSVVTPHAAPAPTLTAAKGRPPVTSTGVDEYELGAPFPSWPS